MPFLNSPKQPIHTLGIGVFDGMHRGHQAIASLCDALLTFYPHPDWVLGKNKTLKLLTTPAERRHYFPHSISARFTRKLASLSAEEFLHAIIETHLSPKRIVVGYDFAFGYKKQGSVAFLKEWASSRGIDVVEIPPITYQGKTVRSAWIREALQTGQFDTAIACLDHSYLMMGTVISGEGRGRTIGFPTANLKVSRHKLIPASGVYSGTVTLQNSSYPAMIYIGKKPTFGGTTQTLEVHLLDFSGHLYGKQLQVHFTQKIRGELKFESIEALTNQIRADIESARIL
jgi:riboflavin kinase/FMN adenylyltransferase